MSWLAVPSLCVYVRICVYGYACMCMLVYGSVHVGLHVCVCVYVSVCAYAHKSACVVTAAFVFLAA
jgi:hypothetical protein